MGVTLSPAQNFSPRRVLEFTQAAERLGLRTAWYPESNQADAIGLLHSAGVLTSRIRLGTAVIPIQTRTPALVAMGFSVLSHLATGRVVLGVGHSSPNVVGRWHGRTFDPVRPLDQVAEFVDAFRTCLREEKAVFHGSYYHVDGFRLRLRPDPAGSPIPVVVGVLGDKAFERAKTFADGALISYILPDRLARLSSAAPAGTGNFEVIVSLNVGVLSSGNGAEKVALAFRRQIVNYAIVDAYANAFGLAGYGDAVSRVRKAWESGDRNGAVEAVPIEMCMDLAAFGTAKEIADRVKKYLDAGATEVALSIVESGETLPAESALSAIAECLADERRLDLE